MLIDISNNLTTASTPDYLAGEVQDPAMARASEHLKKKLHQKGRKIKIVTANF